MLFRINWTKLFPGWCWNFMGTPRFPVDATCKLPNNCHNLCASANFLNRPKMLFILFAGYVWISIISPYREDLRCTSVVTSLPCAGAVDVCHQRSSLIGGDDGWNQPSHVVLWVQLGFVGFHYLLAAKNISNDSYLVIVAVGFTYNLYHLSRVCLKQISGFPNFLRWKMCLFFIIYIVVGKTFPWFCFSAPFFPWSIFCSLQISSASSLRWTRWTRWTTGICALLMTCWAEGRPKPSETFRYDLLDRFRKVHSGGTYLGNIKQWDGKEWETRWSDEGHETDACSKLTSLNRKVWTLRRCFTYISQMLHGTGRFTYRFTMKTSHPSR